MNKTPSIRFGGTCVRLRLAFITSVSIMVLTGCEDLNQINAPATGDWTVTVYVQGYDEFNRKQATQGVTNVTLVAKDRTLQSTIPRGGTNCSFTSIPYQVYVVSAQQDGYFPATVSFFNSYSYGQMFGTARLYSLPSVSSKIDSIACFVNTVVPQVHLELFTAQMLPADGSRTVVLFAGTRPDVSSRFGDYVFASSPIDQIPGTSSIQTADLFRDLRASGIPSGMQIYVTARLTCGATIANVDPETGLNVYSRIESNTKTVATFVMP